MSGRKESNQTNKQNSYQFEQSISVLRDVGWYFSFLFKFNRTFFQANSGVSGLVLHYLSTSHKKDARLITVNKVAHGSIVMFYALTLCLLCNFFHKFFQEYHQCQTVWIQIRPDEMSALIWFQTVCKSYLQTTLEGKQLI